MELLQKAIKIAGACKDNKPWYMACVAKRSDGAIVSSVNHSFFGEKVPQHHAEARVLKKCDHGSVLYVARVLKDRVTVANSMPCPYCQSYIKNMEVKLVYFTISPGLYGVWDPSYDLQDVNFARDKVITSLLPYERKEGTINIIKNHENLKVKMV